MATGDLDPADATQLERLIAAAARYWSTQLHLLSSSDRQEALADAKSAAVEAAMRYRPSPGSTTKWKRAANAAKYAIERYVKARHRTQTGADSIAPDDADDEAPSLLDRATAREQLADEAVGPEYGYSASEDAEIRAFAKRQGISLEEADRIFEEEREAAEERDVEADKRWNRIVDRLRRSLAPVDRFLLETVLRSHPGVPQPSAAGLAEQTGLSEANVRQRRSRLQEWLTELRAGDPRALARLDRLRRSS